MVNNENIKRFETMLRECKRDGIEELIGFLRKSDFYTAPASTRYHSCHEGGLLEHSLNVADCLLNKLENPTWKNILGEVGRESIILCALLHDVCKTYFYVVEMKNKKVYKDTGKKIDSNGRYDWETVPGYTVDDKYPYGHGEKSVMMVERYIKLTPEERYAIRWHMGFTEPKESWNTLTAAMNKYPLVLAIHEADLESTYLLEEEE
jgi:hypothetical protein